MSAPARPAPSIRPAARPAAAPSPPLGGLAGAGSPPLSLPALHFAAALAFWAAGAAGLVWVAPALAAGGFAQPRVVGVAHLFTLGWITTSIMGALCQFVPVALGTPLRWPRAAYASGGAHAAGLALFVGGMLAGEARLFLPGAALFGTALLAFAANLAATLRRAPARTLTWWCLAGATASLVVTVVLGASLTGNLRWGWLGAERFTALAVHVHVALAGFVLPVAVGVAHRLLPMFLLSHGAPEWPERASAACLAAGTVLLLALHHGLRPAVTWTIAALLWAGTVLFVAQGALYFRHRRKPVLDAGMAIAAGGLASLAAALALAPVLVHHGLAAPRVATAYVAAAVVGGLGLFVAGHVYRIIPFLVWFHRWGPRVGKGPVPKVADLFDARPAWVAAGLLGAGVLGLVAAVLAGAPGAARVAAGAYAVGAAVVTAQMIAVFRRRPA